MKRSGPLRRHVRLERGEVKLERRKPMPQRAKKPKRYKAEGADPAYLSWLHTQDCQVARWLADTRWCEGVIEADHAGERGLGMKCPDAEAIAVCSKHHRDRHDCRGFWRGLTKQQRREMLDEAIAETRARYLSAGSRRGR